MIVRDFYFAAWAIEQGHHYRLQNGAVDLEVDYATLRRLKTSYQATDKARFDRVKSLVRTLHKARKIRPP